MKLLILSDLRTEFVAQCWALPRNCPTSTSACWPATSPGRRRRASISPRRRRRSRASRSSMSGQSRFYGARSRTGCASARRPPSARTCVCSTRHRHHRRRALRRRDPLDGLRALWQQPWTMAMAARGLNDHVRIERRGPQGALRFTPADALARHLADRAFIEDALATPYDGPTVVVTRHAPHPGSVARRFANDALTPAFVSDCRRSSMVTRRRCGFTATCTTTSTIASARPGSPTRKATGRCGREADREYRVRCREGGGGLIIKPYDATSCKV